MSRGRDAISFHCCRPPPQPGPGGFSALKENRCGAISGVLGGYFLLFPKRRVRVLIFRFISEVPALVAIGVWFAFQLISSLSMFSGGEGGGVAYGAHIGGFVAGLILVKFFLIGADSKGRLSFP
ncbi:MAG: rhomboid family intramembrane serine protease [Desulfobacterales bacterium]